MEDWTVNALLTGTKGTWSINDTLTSDTTSCAGVQYVFGYYGYDTDLNLIFPDVKLDYASTSFSDGLHWGVLFRANILFIDQWTSTESIIFTSNGV